MLVVFFCIMIKMLEFSSGHVIPNTNGRPRGRLRRHRRGLQRSGHRGMTEEVISPATVNSPESDCNSNHALDKHVEPAGSYVSTASSQEVDFVQDNSDYQWFLDYGYRDGSSAPHHQVSVLSSLSASHGCDDPAYYEDMARNLDANLAEVDMEDFRTEDIHSILTTLPAMCCEDLQAEDSAGSTDTMSICKSELLFSPVKECPLPNTNFSVDSLDCDLLTEHDIMLTCQANKDNYTIAFEGSITLYSEDSDYHEQENETMTSENNNWSRSHRLIRPGKRCGKSRPLDTSMARSDSVYTTWSKLKKRSSEMQLTRHPSGNNNTCPDNLTSLAIQQASALKSQSLPNLYRQRRRCFLASFSNRLNSAMSSSVESETRLPHGGCVKLYDVQHHNSSSLLSAQSETNSSVDGGTSSCSGSARKQNQQHNFSLVKLFMKQKSMSNEGMCYAMDQSSASECWPTSNNSQSEAESDSCGQDYVRQRRCQTPNMVACYRDSNNEIKACCSLNDCDCANTTACENDNNTKVKERYNMSDNGNRLKTVTALDEATNNWIRPEELTTDYSTCCFEDSLVEPSRKDDILVHQRHELIEEEDEPSSDHSESVEQLSESVSKIEESTLDLGASSCNSEQHFLLSSHTNGYKVPKPKCTGVSSVPKTVSKFNINNNNSLEDVHSPVKRRQSKGQSQGTQTKRLSSGGSTPSPSSGSESIGSCSSCAETETTKVQRLSPTGTITTSRHVSTQIPLHLMNRSIQTSGFSDVSTLKSAPFQLLENPNGTSLVKVIEPTVKPNLGVGKLLGDNIKKPVYVFYPNYTLPDLAFLRDKRKELDVAEVLLMPQKFSPPSNAPPTETDGATNIQQKTAKTPSSGAKSRRPFSCTDVEALKKKGFSHVRDWDSLTFLLPKEYRQILAEVPEIVPHLKGKEGEMLRPLFCVSPPLRKARPASCDCASLLMAADGKTNPNISSSSSTATQPSSGYRGSSTILTDSSSNHTNPGSNYNPLFVYRYDSVSSESSMMSNQPQGKLSSVPPLPKRSISLPTGGETKKCPPAVVKDLDCGNAETPPRPPLPRSILRKSLENSNSSRYNCKMHKNNANSKRYSMFELGGEKSSEFHYNNEDKFLLAQNKRRSLQDIDYVNLVGSPRKTAEVHRKPNDNIARRLSPRLHPEKDVDEMEDDYYDDEGVDAGTDSSFEECHNGYQVRPPTPPIPKTPDSDGHCCVGSAKTSPSSGAPCKNNEEQILKLEEFLHLSGLSVLCSGENLEDWDEAEMQKLKLQVSKFLLSKQQVENELEGVCRTPNNTPEHHSACDCSRTKKSVSFAEKVCVHERDVEPDRTRLMTPPNSPNVAATNAASKPYQCKMNIPLVDMPIREEGESSPDGTSSPPSECSRLAFIPPMSIAPRSMAMDLAQKRTLVTAVSDAVEQMIHHFSAAENQTHCTMLGDSSRTPACAHLALNKLCPALYAVLSDGLRPCLDTAFGSIHNSVWQVVEASAQQGLMTKALNDLVLRINSEDVLTEGLMKFNAFVFGLLNVRSLDAWVGYLRTRESVLRKHYTGDGLLVLANTAGASVRALTDQLLASLQPLALLPFRLDLLFECRQLHLSLRRVGSLQQPSPPEIPQTNAGSPSTGKQWTLRKLVRSIQSSLTASADEEGHAAWYQRSKPSSAETLLRKALSDEDATHHPNCSGNSPEAPLPDLLDSSAKVWSTEEKQRPRSCVDATNNGVAGAAGSFSLMTDIASTVKKRWSGIHLGSKLFQAFDRLGAEDTEEEYTDSLETTPRLSFPKQKQPSNSSDTTSDECSEITNKDNCILPKPQQREEGDGTRENTKVLESENKIPITGGGKFKRLQMKWEMLSGKEAAGKVSPAPSPTSPHKSPDSNNSSMSSGGRSKIPRPVTSPVRTSGIPVLSPQVGRTNMKKVAMTSPAPANPALQLRKPTPVSTKLRNSPSSLKDALDSPTTPTSGVLKRPNTRPSRVDQLQDHCNSAAVRPSSLPYRPPQGLKGPQSRRPDLQRRAASSSLNRQKNQRESQSPSRFVRTLCHRLPSDSGHLSFNEGERLRLVLEVDDKWLLCCRGDQKGLVPRAAVIEHNQRF